MNETTRTQIAALEDMRLPELWARYVEVLGETTRCPNRRFLIRKITEVLQAGTEGVAQQVGNSETAAEPPAQGTSMDMEQARTVIMANVDPMGYDTAEQYVEECYGQVAPEAMPGLLVEAAQIILANAAAAEEPGNPGPVELPVEPTTTPTALSEPAPPAEPAPTSEPASSEPAPVADPAPPRKLSKLTVPELQARYLEVVGRESGSVNVAYLCWKIRQAEKGKIPVGRRQERTAAAEPQDYKVLPLRMEAELVAKLDEARERLGLKSRMDLFRHALHTYLAAAGEQEVAALFVPEA